MNYYNEIKNNMCYNFNGDSMEKEKTYLYEMKVGTLNIVSLIFFAVLVLITILIIVLSGNVLKLSDSDMTIVFILLVPYLVIHEILHSIGYVVNGANFKNITYGVHLEKSILCCSCKQGINKKNILWSLMYPFLFIGVITYIIGLVFNLPILIVLSIANITGCSGDIIMFLDFLKIKKFRFFEYDNPLAFGIITSENLENKKLFGLKMIEEKSVTQTIDKKINISKPSFILFAIYLAFILIDIFL